MNNPEEFFEELRREKHHKSLMKRYYISQLKLWASVIFLVVLIGAIIIGILGSYYSSIQNAKWANLKMLPTQNR